MKAAFDLVDREVLLRVMRERGVREGLVRRCEKVLRETVRVNGREGESFWTRRGERQGCPLSPCLFTLLLADVDEELERGRWGGIRVGNRKIYSMAYTDDIVVVVEDENEMKGMISKLEKYLDGKGLEVNTEKTKIMRCRKGGGRWRKIAWR